jgi:hypothetical protein
MGPLSLEPLRFLLIKTTFRKDIQSLDEVTA